MWVSRPSTPRVPYDRTDQPMPSEIRDVARGASPRPQSGEQSVDTPQDRPICPECGSPNRPQSQFCGNCGAALRRYCLHCGQPIRPDLDSCPSCSAATRPSSGSATRCQTCGFENEEQAEVCQQCGARLLANCPQCGALNRASFSFCPRCGFDYSRFVADRLIPVTPRSEPEPAQPGKRLSPSSIVMAALMALSVALMVYILLQI
jgi:hypothetical protein